MILGGLFGGEDQTKGGELKSYGELVYTNHSRHFRRGIFIPKSSKIKSKITEESGVVKIIKTIKNPSSKTKQTLDGFMGIYRRETKSHIVPPVEGWNSIVTYKKDETVEVPGYFLPGNIERYGTDILNEPSEKKGGKTGNAKKRKTPRQDKTAAVCDAGPVQASSLRVRGEVMQKTGEDYGWRLSERDKSTGDICEGATSDETRPEIPLEYLNWLSFLKGCGFLNYAFTKKHLKSGINSKLIADLSEELHYYASGMDGGATAKKTTPHYAKHIRSAKNKATFKRFFRWMEKNVEDDWMKPYRETSPVFEGGYTQFSADALALNFLHDSVRYLQKEGILNI